MTIYLVRRGNSTISEMLGWLEAWWVLGPQPGMSGKLMRFPVQIMHSESSVINES
jgi:hypothetical protein